MKRWTLLILVFSICLSVSLLVAQSITDAAKKERERRERVKEQGKAFTEKDLKGLSERSNITTGASGKGSNLDRNLSTTGTISIPIQRMGSTMIVVVELNNQLKTSLAVDTGASITSISKPIAASLGLKITDRTRFIPMHTANGVIMSPLVKLNSLRVGDIEVTDIDVSIIENWNDTKVTGLLGMNFLSGFDWSTDAANDQLLLRPLSTAAEGSYGGHSKDWWVERFHFLHTSLERLRAQLKQEEKFGSRDRVSQIRELIEHFETQLDMLTRQANEAGVPKEFRK